MKLNLVVLALLGHSQAVRLTFVDDYDEIMADNEVVQQEVEHNSKIETQLEQKPVADVNVGTQAEVNVKSDPIFGSLGKEEPKNGPQPDWTYNRKLEWDLSHRTPVKFKLDPTVHGDTRDSIEWAESVTGQHMSTPPREHDDEDKRARFDFSPDQSDEVSDTLRSAHQAEVELGYHYHGKRGEEVEAGPVPDTLNGTIHFHNQEAYFERGFAGDHGSNPNAIPTLGGEYDGTGTGADHHSGRDRRWWKHLERDSFDGMKYVRNDSSLFKQEPDFKNGLKIEIEGLDDSWYQGYEKKPAAKKVEEEEEEEKPKKKAKQEEPAEEEEEVVPKTKKKAAAPPEEAEVKTKKPKMPIRGGGPGYTRQGDPADKGEENFLPPELDPNFGQGMVQKSAPTKKGGKSQSTINVDGQDIPIGDMSVEGDDPNADSFLQVQENEQTEELLELSNQEKLEQYMRNL